MKKIACRLADDSVAVVVPAQNARLASGFGALAFDPPVPAFRFWRGGPEPEGIVWAETEDQFIARIMAKDTPAGTVETVIVQDKDLPDYDSETRNAWRVKAGKVEVDEAVADSLRQAKES